MDMLALDDRSVAFHDARDGSRDTLVGLNLWSNLLLSVVLCFLIGTSPVVTRVHAYVSLQVPSAGFT